MQMDFNDVVRKAIAHKATLDTNRKDIRDNTIIIERRQAELDELNDLYRVTKEAQAYLDTLVKEESGKFIKRLNDVLDYGVKTIFFDCNYSIEIRTTDESKITIHLVFDDDTTGVKLSPDIRTCGGGIRTVCGILLQIVMISHYRVEPIIFIDEGFSQVSSEYIPYLMTLLKELAIKNNFKVLLITHDDRMLPYADKRYIIEDHSSKEVKITSNGKEDDLIECDSDSAE